MKQIFFTTIIAGLILFTCAQANKKEIKEPVKEKVVNAENSESFKKLNKQLMPESININNNTNIRLTVLNDHEQFKKNN